MTNKPYRSFSKHWKLINLRGNSPAYSPIPKPDIRKEETRVRSNLNLSRVILAVKREKLLWPSNQIAFTHQVVLDSTYSNITKSIKKPNTHPFVNSNETS